MTQLLRTLRILLLACLCLVVSQAAESQVVIVDHTSVALFEQIPEVYLDAAAGLRMMFVDRSVGGNINDGLTCLGYESDEVAPSSCKRYTHVVPEYSSPPSEVNWFHPGGYDRSNWAYYGWPGLGIPPELPCGPTSTGGWSALVECFIDYVDANPTAYDVYGLQFSYLQVASGANIASPTSGYFVPHAGAFDIGDFEALEARHPTRIFIQSTTSLARSIGTQEAVDFNTQQRDYVRVHGGYLLDVADIESHDPWGQPCYDNRDGVPYIVNGVVLENHPDDGLALPAVCPQYTREAEGGHLGNPEPGKIRLAKAFWVLMAQIAGWSPAGSTGAPAAPANLRIIR